MSQEGTIQVKFAECTCFVGFHQYKYDGGGIPILNMSRDIIMNKWEFDGKNINKNWTKRNVNGVYIDAIKDKYVYIFSKSESGTKIEEELKLKTETVKPIEWKEADKVRRAVSEKLSASRNK